MINMAVYQQKPALVFIPYIYHLYIQSRKFGFIDNQLNWYVYNIS